MNVAESEYFAFVTLMVPAPDPDKLLKSSLAAQKLI